MRDAINLWETQSKTTSGRDAFIIKKALIEMRKDQYVIKAAYRRPLTFNKITRSRLYIPLIENEPEFTADGFVKPSGISLMDP